MASDIDKLRSLYIKYDILAASGDDVVADLRKEINNLELSVLRDCILPKVAKLLYKETCELRCNIDCSLQSIDGKIEYSFCTDNSPLVRSSLSEVESKESDTLNEEVTYNNEIIEKLSSSLARLSELTAEIEFCKSKAIKYVSQLQRPQFKTEDGCSMVIEQEDSPETRKFESKHRAMFSLNGGRPMNKRQTVLETIRLYVKTHPTATFEQLETVFPKELQGSYGIITPISTIRSRIQNGYDDERRYYLDRGKILRSFDGIEFAVCSQWGHQFSHFQTYVYNTFNWTIKEI